jgi:release factor glutamine methyltransferase
MTYRQLCTILGDAKIENAEYDAQRLMEHFCAVSPSLLRAAPDRDYDNVSLEDAVRRRLAHEPLQYILGEWEFYRQTYEVTPDCLIPRADTEILVETAIRLLPIGAHFADLCTGSGCIAISTLAERPDTKAIALEKFPATLALAERNATKNGVTERFCGILADVLSPNPFWEKEAPFDAILSNPPYIPTKDIDTLSPEVHAEPSVALDGGEDGLLFYRAILKNYTPLLKKDGFFLFEIGFDQADDLISLGREHNFAHIRVIRDFGGNDRVVYLSNIPFDERSSVL